MKMYIMYKFALKIKNNYLKTIIIIALKTPKLIKNKIKV